MRDEESDEDDVFHIGVLVIGWVIKGREWEGFALIDSEGDLFSVF